MLSINLLKMQLWIFAYFIGQFNCLQCYMSTFSKANWIPLLFVNVHTHSLFCFHTRPSGLIKIVRSVTKTTIYTTRSIDISYSKLHYKTLKLFCARSNLNDKQKPEAFVLENEKVCYGNDIRREIIGEFAFVLYKEGLKIHTIEFLTVA